MVTIYSDSKKKNVMGRMVVSYTGKDETTLRQICEENLEINIEKNTKKLFIKTKSDPDIGVIIFKSISTTEAKLVNSKIYLWKDYIIEFDIS